MDPEQDSKKDEKGGLLSKLAFWKSGDAKKTPAQYRILVKATGSDSIVSVLSKDGGPEKTDTANRIISLLFEQLK